MGLQEIWFILIAVLFTGYFVLEGFDFGVGMHFPVLGRGRTVEADTGAGAAQHDRSGLGRQRGLAHHCGRCAVRGVPRVVRDPLLRLLPPAAADPARLIVRVCAIEWRGKVDDPTWRRRCDWGIIFGSWVPAVLWGVAFANIVRGVAIDADKQYVGGFFDLLNPYALLGGATTALVFALHGAVFIALKTEGQVRTDAVAMSRKLAVPAVLVAGAFVVWTQLAYGKAGRSRSSPWQESPCSR